jgi:hypothetical protein
MPSFCKPAYPYDNINIRFITVNGDVSWSETKDHSKVPPALMSRAAINAHLEREDSGRSRTRAARATSAWGTSTGSSRKPNAEAALYIIPISFSPLHSFLNSRRSLAPLLSGLNKVCAAIPQVWSSLRSIITGRDVCS